MRITHCPRRTIVHVYVCVYTHTFPFSRKSPDDIYIYFFFFEKEKCETNPFRGGSSSRSTFKWRAGLQPQVYSQEDTQDETEAGFASAVPWSTPRNSFREVSNEIQVISLPYDSAKKQLGWPQPLEQQHHLHPVFPASLLLPTPHC